MIGGQAASSILEKDSNVIRLHGLTPASFAPMSADARLPDKIAIFRHAGFTVLAVLMCTAMAAALAGISFSSVAAAAAVAALAIASFRHSAQAASEPPISSPNCWPSGWF
jgi:hypothetical protein